MKRTALLLSFLTLFTTAAPGQTARTLIDTLHAAIASSRGAAQSSVVDLRDLSSDLPGLILVPKASLDGMSPGPSFPIAVVRLDRLKNYDSHTQPNGAELLTPTNRAFHFVLAEGVVISGVEVMREGDDWYPARLGLTPLAEDLQDTLGKLHISSGDAILIEIPAFGRWFVGFEMSGKMKVAELQRPPASVVVSIPLEELLQSLVQPARDHNGLSS